MSRHALVGLHGQGQRALSMGPGRLRSSVTTDYAEAKACGAENNADGTDQPLTEIAPPYCKGTIRLSRTGCAVGPVEHVLVGIMILASLLYFGSWVFFIYRSKFALNRKPYSDFKIANLMLRIQVRLLVGLLVKVCTKTAALPSSGPQLACI